MGLGTRSQHGVLGCCVAMAFLCAGCAHGAMTVCVKTSGAGACDVVRDNIAQPGYLAPRPGSSKHLHAVPASANSTAFAIVVDSQDQHHPAASVVASAHGPDVHAKALLTFHPHSAFSAANGNLTVGFVCLRGGESIVTVEIMSTANGSAGPVAEFTILKRCKQLTNAHQQQQQQKNQNLSGPRTAADILEVAPSLRYMTGLGAPLSHSSLCKEAKGARGKAGKRGRKGQVKDANFATLPHMLQPASRRSAARRGA